MQHPNIDEIAPGLRKGASKEEIEAWAATDQAGVKTTLFENEKFAMIAFDRDSPHNDKLGSFGDVMIIGMPLPWLYVKITVLQNKGYKKILVRPFDTITKNGQLRVEQAPGLLVNHSTEEFDAWMESDPIGIKTTIDEAAKTVTITYEKFLPWIFLRVAWYENAGYKVIY